MKSFLLAVLISCILLPCSAADSIPPLKAGVSLSDHLPSVPLEMAPGSEYSPDAVSKHYKSTEDWRRVPAWKVGSFHVETEIHYTPAGPKEILSRLDTSGGHLRDSKGHYWQRYDVPMQAAPVEGASIFQYSNIISDESIEISPKKVVSRIRGISFIVDKETRKIVRVAQQEVLQTETPAGPNRYRTDCQRRLYDSQGRYVSDLKSTTFADRTEPFEPIVQLERSFRQFLLSQGRPDLLP
jgi:hypothetical protein